MKISFLGGGNMANAMIGGLLKQGVPSTDICVVEPGAETRARLQADYGVGVFDLNPPAAVWTEADVIVLAVKPQQMKDAVAPLGPHLHGQVVVSIAAGLPVAALSRWLGGYPGIVRVMPNTPAVIGAGISGLYAAPAVSDAGRLAAEQVMRAAGSTVWVGEETDMDAVTAISGSGPAYVFLFIEALQQAAAELGLNAEQAWHLSIETVLGAAQLAATSAESAAVLRQKVTSKGGTTEAALKVMAERGVLEGIVAGAHAARARGAEMGALLGAD